jgi:hypothetical protein
MIIDLVDLYTDGVVLTITADRELTIGAYFEYNDVLWVVKGVHYRISEGANINGIYERIEKTTMIIEKVKIIK